MSTNEDISKIIRIKALSVFVKLLPFTSPSLALAASFQTPPPRSMLNEWLGLCQCHWSDPCSSSHFLERPGHPRSNNTSIDPLSGRLAFILAHCENPEAVAFCHGNGGACGARRDMGVGSSIDNPFRWETFWLEQYKYITAFSVIWKVYRWQEMRKAKPTSERPLYD